MKIELSDLKKAVKWIEENSNDTSVNVVVLDGKLYLSCVDRYGVGVEITLFEGSTMMPKIKKEDILR